MGEIENGISMSVISSFLPLKEKRVIAQAAAMPKPVLIGTTTMAVSTVSQIACAVLLSETAAQ